MMASEPPFEGPEVIAARELAKTIADFRKEFMDKTHQDFERELEQMVEDGFDPARGRGRGPRWADGG
jgi:hypothetical protein